MERIIRTILSLMLALAIFAVHAPLPALAESGPEAAEETAWEENEAEEDAED